MITLTILNLKTRKSNIECFTSKDKAEHRLQKLKVKNEEARDRTGEYLEAWSYDTSSEKALVESYLPEIRQITGKDL